MKYLDFFGTRISIINQKELLSSVMNFIELPKAHYVTFSNVHVVVTTRKDEGFRAAINDADIAAPDGMPLIWVGRLKKQNIERCSGPDMMKFLIEKGLSKGTKHYFYGSTPETLDKLTKELKKEYPEIVISGSYSPPFRSMTEEEDRAIVDTINELNPDMIWVGLGAPKQEIWMREHREGLNRGVMLGVGAAFDFHAHTVKRAPMWMQKVGLEWFFRLLHEPKRLFSRYAKTNTLFIYYLLRYRVKVSR